jgi:hypothetical protein
MIYANSVPRWAIGDWRQFPEAKILYLLHEVLRGIQECLAATSPTLPRWLQLRTNSAFERPRRRGSV